MKRILIVAGLFAALVFSAQTAQAAKAKFEGYKKCGGCHKSQKDSWLETTHSKAFDSLKPKKNAKEKKKAKLDPDKDYTKDKKCIGCHVTGFAKSGGYRTGLPKAKAKYLKGVGCEDCHGAGSLYRKEHRKASNKFKKTKKKSPRKTLVKLGEIFDYKEACARCHLNYKGSGWKGVKEPYTPFTPDVDSKYKFDYEKSVREAGKDKAMHEHFKLKKQVFTGEPVPKIRAEFQKDAKEPAEPEEEEEEEEDK
jgi:hypothetical protein